MAALPFPPGLMLAGPTAAGKSEVALLLARRLSGEIVSVDSMQVYRGMDVGTAKPTVEERQSVRHHLIDVVDCSEAFDAARFVSLAEGILREVADRRRLPILCGGTGLYFKALLEGIGDAPSSDPDLRSALEKTPLPALLQELAEKDPQTFQHIDRKNPRRVVRAVEVLRLTGRPHSQQKAVWDHANENAARETSPVFVLRRGSDDLQARINIRVERMFASGLVDETRRLLGLGLEQNRTAMQAIGYRQVAEHLRGMRSLPETIELVKTKTRQFAKRQMTWYRRQLPVCWIDVAKEEPAGSVADRIQVEFERIK
ncbi:MAG TPA: tRNA (adenosine(37)-N6)-dimethylallyltransferase MiaA [Verrucomicrobiae bacterium]|nr:tRNA (adenosine(37)-N6)-dimethylallyltransferase MiaA [Verrucomicrobiae bacterium]